MLLYIIHTYIHIELIHQLQNVINSEISREKLNLQIVLFTKRCNRSDNLRSNGAEQVEILSSVLVLSDQRAVCYLNISFLKNELIESNAYWTLFA
jgi:hypothetical protein